MPPKREAFLLVIGDLVEERRLIILYLLEDGAHERFANQTTSILHTVFQAEFIQRPLFPFVEHDRNPIGAR